MKKRFKFCLLLPLPVIIFLALAGCGRSDPLDGHLYNPIGWGKRMQDPSLSKSDFTRLYAQAAAARFGGCKVYVTGDREVTMKPYDGEEFKATLKDLWAETAKDPASRPAVCQRHLDALVASKAALGATAVRVDTNTILPVISNDPFIQQIKMKQRKDGDKLLVEPFTADIYILYFGSRDGNGVFLNEGDLSLLHLDLPVMHKLAAGNLINLLPLVKHQDPDPLFTIVAGGRYESSLLLADPFWDKQTSAVRGELIAAVPSHGTLFFTGSASPDGLKQLHQKAQQVYDSSDEAISKTLLVRRNGKWEALKE